MKICYLNHDSSPSTGAGRFYNSLSAAVKKAIPGVSIEVLTSENILRPNKLKLIFRIPKIRKIFTNCDLIHALDGWPYGVIAAIANLGLRKPLIITAIGTGAVKPLYNPFKRWLMKWAYKRADKVVAVSHNTKKEILKFLPDLKIEVINHGVNFANFQSLNPTTPYPKPYVLSVGALKKRKGYEYSIEAFAEVAKKFPELKYVIVGGGPERKNLELRIMNYELRNRVVFMDNLPEEELIALYKNAELFILLSQDDQKDIEGFGLVFLEAAAAGLPVVASRGTSAEDAVLDGQNGILVPPRDWKAAAEAIEKVLGDSNLRKSFSERSLRFAQSMTWDVAAKKYKVLYENSF